MKRIVIPVAVAAFIFTSCSSTSSPRGSSGDNDNPGYSGAYIEILEEYEDKLLLIENSEEHSFDPCALCDITGDGIPELFIVYASDEEEGHPAPDGDYELAALSIYTYDEEHDRAESMMHWPSFANFEDREIVPGTNVDTGDTLAELVRLNNGNIIIHYTFSVLDSFYDNYLELAYEDGDLTRVSAVEGAVTSVGAQYFVESDSETGVMDEAGFEEFIAGYTDNVRDVIFTSSDRIDAMNCLSDQASLQMSYDDVLRELDNA